MVLHNVHTGDGPGSCDIRIEGDKITAITAAGNTAGTIHFEQAIAFPGLINSHDHLDFNSFPPLGNRIYEDYVAWGDDIHVANRHTIDDILRIPKELRVQWSLYKNLLSGVTTVVQHGEYFNVSQDLVHVFQDCVSIHSVQLEKNWKLRLTKPRKDNLPVVIHIGEGTNAAAAAEIGELLRWNLLRKKLIGIHGVAMNTEQARKFHALVWSPDSNYFLLDKTADIARLKEQVPIVFGTDSTLTAHWSILEQLKLALNTGMVTQQELFDMVTSLPAQVWGMSGYGSLAAGKTADIVVARRKNNTGYLDNFFALKPEDLLLVLHNGAPRMFDASLYEQVMQLPQCAPGDFSCIQAGNSRKYVFGNLPALMAQIRQFAPGIVFPDISIV